MAIRRKITDSTLVGQMEGKTVVDLISAMNDGDTYTYTNIHTQENSKGEIRGQIEMSSNATGTSSSIDMTLTNATAVPTP